MSAFEESARLYDEAASKLEIAARHCRVAARHMREQEVPRACAHAFAARGDLLEARDALDRMARVHASKSNPDA